MACELRERTGKCRHSQCPFPYESGFNCVEIVGGFCEIGEDCVERCDFSWRGTDARARRNALRAFEVKYGTTI